MYQADVHIKPLSVNKVWQGRRFKTDDYKRYERDLIMLLPKGKVSGEIEVTIELFLKNEKRTDIDNPIKPLFDILTKKGVWDDDCKIVSLHVHKSHRVKEGMRITIAKA